MKTLSLVVLLSALAAPALAQNKNCSLEYKTGKLSWTAFKTPAKVGVNAGFDAFSVKAQKGISVEDVLNGASFEVQTHSVNSGDKARDAKIVTFFFQHGGKKVGISGKVTAVKDGKAMVAMTINGTTKEIAMPYTYNQTSRELVVKGQVNVLDFMLNDNLAALTKACMEKHEGKTWPEVDIQIAATLASNCK